MSPTRTCDAHAETALATGAGAVFALLGSCVSAVKSWLICERSYDMILGRSLRISGISVYAVRSYLPKDDNGFPCFAIQFLMKREYVVASNVPFPYSGVSLHFLYSERWVIRRGWIVSEKLEAFLCQFLYIIGQIMKKTRGKAKQLPTSRNQEAVARRRGLILPTSYRQLRTSIGSSRSGRKRHRQP